MTKYVLGTYVEKHECIETEYKEFCLKHNIFKYATKDHVRSFFMDNILWPNFNKIIISNLTCYLNSYIPRYTCSFHNTPSFNKYEFYIGIDDNNEITGIPFHGDLRRLHENLTKTIGNCLNNSISNVCCYTWELKIYKCGIDTDVIGKDTIEDELQNIRKHQLHFQVLYNEYTSNKQKWITKLFLYKGKLQQVLNHAKIKKKFILFLKRNNVYHMFEEMLNDNSTYISSKDVKYKKNNKYDIIYWLILFKDEKVKRLMTKKPEEPETPKYLHTDINMINTLSKLRTRFIKLGISYFIIKLQFSKKNCCTDLIKYKTNRGVWKTMMRTIGPQCKEII